MQQGRIHGHQLRRGGQGRKCAFPHFSTRVHGPTDQPTDGRTDKASYRVACPQLKIKKANHMYKLMAGKKILYKSTLDNLNLSYKYVN